MKRKTIQLNPSTLAVTIPKKWAEKYNIKKGTELIIKEEQNRIIFSNMNIEGEKATVNLRKWGAFEKNLISSLYQAGIDEIELYYDDPNIIPIIEDHISKYCIGFDIIEQTKDRLIIKSIATDIVIEFEKLYKKNIQLMIQMAKEVNESIKKGDYSVINLTRNLEQQQNKIHTLVLRYISKKGFPLNPKRDKAAYELVREIENICDGYKRICDYLMKENPKISKELKNYTDMVSKYVINFYDFYYNFNKHNSKIFFRDGKNLVDMGYKLFKTERRNVEIIHHLIDILKRTYFLSHPWFEIIVE